MNKHVLFPSLLLGLSLIIAACDQNDLSLDKVANNVTNAVSDNASAPNINTLSATDYSTEELLGKTPEEYAALQKQRSEENQTQTEETKEPQNKSGVIKNGFLQVDWEALVAPGYDVNSILKRYEPQIAKIEHGSEAAFKLYIKMQEEFDNAPTNEELANRKISLPGFIAPLEQQDGIITEFLLVPYFGACIHLPPPPANQTVYVKTARDYGIKLEDSYEAIWVSGEIEIDGKATDIGSASYKIQQAVISPYTY